MRGLGEGQTWLGKPGIDGWTETKGSPVLLKGWVGGWVGGRDLPMRPHVCVEGGGLLRCLDDGREGCCTAWLGPGGAWGRWWVVEEGEEEEEVAALRCQCLCQKGEQQTPYRWRRNERTRRKRRQGTGGAWDEEGNGRNDGRFHQRCPNDGPSHHPGMVLPAST